ncbi:hypothetical protein F7725_006702 [Dissostichus mawsoni]|uniref:Uncharacterized protein n=1 Tax=Dissostichus mawsoni TaxID=36200 RepID=A0A7J5XWF6_DISMA|nr:hypothetical protein F7725_006702 [Dissostichus mawsoni]
MAEKFLTPNIPKLEIVKVPPWGNKTHMKKTEICTKTDLLTEWFSVPGFGSERRHVGADANEPFGVSVEHDGRDETVGCAHCYTHVHHMVQPLVEQSCRYLSWWSGNICHSGLYIILEGSDITFSLHNDAERHSQGNVPGSLWHHDFSQISLLLHLEAYKDTRQGHVEQGSSACQAVLQDNINIVTMTVPDMGHPHHTWQNKKTLFGFTDGRLVSLDLSQQISFTQLLSHFLLPALHCSHRHGGREGRKCDLSCPGRQEQQQQQQEERRRRPVKGWLRLLEETPGHQDLCQVALLHHLKPYGGLRAMVPVCMVGDRAGSSTYRQRYLLVRRQAVEPHTLTAQPGTPQQSRPVAQAGAPAHGPGPAVQPPQSSGPGHGAGAERSRPGREGTGTLEPGGRPEPQDQTKHFAEIETLYRAVE